MKLKNYHKIIKICVAALIVFISVVYLGFVRDWYKKTQVNEELILSIAQKVNQYDDLKQLHMALTQDGNQLDFYKLWEVDKAIYGSREEITEYISINETDGKMMSNEFMQVITQNDLESILDEKFGSFRPIFNLFCTNRKSDYCTYWLSPNMYTKGCYGVAYDNDRIHLVIFCEKYTISICQEQQNGDKAFEEYLRLLDKSLI